MSRRLCYRFRRKRLYCINIVRRSTSDTLDSPWGATVYWVWTVGLSSGHGWTATGSAATRWGAWKAAKRAAKDHNIVYWV